MVGQGGGSSLANHVIDKRFLIRRLLGEGAAARVYEAQALVDCGYVAKGGRVAIKSYKTWVLEEQHQGVRIGRELELGTHVNNPHVVRSYELVEDNGLHLVMQYVQGKTLAQWIRDNPNPPFNEIISIIGQAAQGLAVLHQNKLIHRDVKPENIMLSANHVTIMDLGVVTGITDSTVMTGDKFLGTIRYAAPEYLFHEEYDARIDAYSLGMVAYELVFGESFIDPETPWSVQVLAKGDTEGLSEDDHLTLEYFGHRGIRHGLFLWSLVTNSLAEAKERITCAQIASAIQGQAWRKPFPPSRDFWFNSDELHGGNLRDWGQRFAEAWPNLPVEIQTKVGSVLSNVSGDRLQQLKPMLQALAISERPRIEQRVAEIAFKPLMDARLVGLSKPMPEEVPNVTPRQWRDTVYPYLTPAGWQALLALEGENEG